MKKSNPQNYLDFLQHLLKASNQKQKMLTSSLTRESRISGYAVQAAENLGYVTIERPSNKSPATITWLRANGPTEQDAQALIVETGKLQKEQKQNSERQKQNEQKQIQHQLELEEAAKPKFAKVQINSATIRVPVIDGRVEVEVGDDKIVVNME